MHESGLQIGIGAFQYYVFWNFRVVQDNEWGHYRTVTDFLDGRGVHNLEEIRQEVILQPILGPFRGLVNQGFFRWSFDSADEDPEEVRRKAIEKYRSLLAGIIDYTQISSDPASALTAFETYFSAGMDQIMAHGNPHSLEDWAIMLGWAIIRPLGLIGGEENYIARSRSWMDEWQLSKIFYDCFRQLEIEDARVGLLQSLVGRQAPWFSADAYRTLRSWLQNAEIARQMGVNRYQDVLWYNRTGLADVLSWAKRLAAAASEPVGPNLETIVQDISAADEEAGYQVAALLAALETVEKTGAAENTAEEE
jgi:hypothetical protein